MAEVIRIRRSELLVLLQGEGATIFFLVRLVRLKEDETDV